MIFSYNWLQEYIKAKLPTPEKLAELLSMHSFEVENFKELKTDWVFDIKVLPNRAHDCLCHTGIAREIAAIAETKLQLPKTKNIKVQNLKPLKVRIQSSQLVPRYAAIVVEGVKVAESPKWLTQRLETVGINSINNVVDLTNFVMLEMGQPLHAFDFNSIRGNAMTIRQARNGEKIETLDNKTLLLQKGMLIIQNSNRIIDLAGIKGGKGSAIGKHTKNILIQAANFSASSIYRTKATLNYSSQAADIYAHDIDPNLAMQALERAVALLPELGVGGKVVQLIDVYAKKVKPKHILLDMEFVESLLGTAVSAKQAKQILENLDCKVQTKGNRLRVAPPTRRLDLATPEDLVEEIGRIHGYDTIAPVFPVVPLSPTQKTTELLWQENIRDRFKEIGFCEVYNYSLQGQKEFSQFLYSKTDLQALVALENAMSKDLSHLRDSLLEHLLQNIQENQKKVQAMRIFEMGKVFQRTKGNLQETNMLGALVYDGGFYEMKGICDFMLQSLGITQAWYDDYQQTPETSRFALWNKEKSAEIKIDSKEIGFLGEISSSLLSRLKITKPVGALYINVDDLVALASEEKEYRAPSRFPAITRDIAILVPLETKVVQVLNALEALGGELVQDIDVFDIYEGEQAHGKKNFAFHIVYQADNRTLTNREVDALHNHIITEVEKNPEWEVRK